MDSFLKAYKASETNVFSLTNDLTVQTSLTVRKCLQEAFFSKLRNHNPLEKHFNDYQKLVNGGLDQQSVLKKLRIQSVPPPGFKNYSYLKNIWEQHSMNTFKDFLRWYNNKDVVPILEAMQKKDRVSS